MLSSAPLDWSGSDAENVRIAHGKRMAFQCHVCSNFGLCRSCQEPFLRVISKRPFRGITAWFGSDKSVWSDQCVLRACVLVYV